MWQKGPNGENACDGVGIHTLFRRYVGAHAVARDTPRSTFVPDFARPLSKCSPAEQPFRLISSMLASTAFASPS